MSEMSEKELRIVKRIMPILIPLWLWIMFHPDNVIEPAMVYIQKTEKYELYTRKKRQRIVINSGKLGQFAECLKGYKNIAHRKIKSNTGGTETVYINVNSKVVINADISGKEIYSFSIRVINEDGEWGGSSRLYAVNCPLSLLEPIIEK